MLFRLILTYYNHLKKIGLLV